MRNLVFFSGLSFPLSLTAQISKQPEYINFEKAKTILDHAVQYSGFLSDSLNIGISASGIMHESGHFATPEERVDMPETYTLRLFSGIRNFFIGGEIQYQGRTYLRQVYVKQDSIFYRDHFDRSITRMSLSSRVTLYDEILTLHPVLILNAARRSLSSLRYIGKDGSNDLISFAVNQTLFTLHILPSGQLSQSSCLATHDYYGDNVHQYEYQDYKVIAGYQLPTRFKEYEFGALRKEQTFTYNLNPSGTLPTNQVCLGCLLVPKSTTADDVTVKNISGDLYAVELNSFNNRSLFLVGATGITVFEAPKSYNASQRVIEAVRRTSGKPITQVVLTHHHPDHAGGLRAFVELGATVITTKNNTDFFSRFVNYAHRLEGRAEEKPLKPTYTLVDSVKTFNVAPDESFLVCFIGDTQHTQEHLVTYFPKQKVLFQGDLCLFKLDGESAASVREQAVGRLINRYKIDVEKIYGSWPLRGYKEFGTKAELDRKLELAAK